MTENDKFVLRSKYCAITHTFDKRYIAFGNAQFTIMDKANGPDKNHFVLDRNDYVNIKYGQER